VTRAETIGYAAALCVFLTFYMRTMIPLRVAGIVGNEAANQFDVALKPSSCCVDRI
jgi:hypothetical protein